MKLNDFGQLFESFQRDAFRLQLLDKYDVESEADDYNQYMAGRTFPDRSNDSWLQTMGRHVADGCTWSNIHVLPSQLTDYLRYVIDWWYVYQAQAGADVRFVLSENAESLRRMVPRDFWLFDDSRLVWMHYDDAGRFLGPMMSMNADELALARGVRDRARASSIDLAALLARRRSGQLV